MSQYNQQQQPPPYGYPPAGNSPHNSQHFPYPPQDSSAPTGYGPPSSAPYGYPPPGSGPPSSAPYGYPPPGDSAPAGYGPSGSAPSQNNANVVTIEMNNSRTLSEDQVPEEVVDTTMAFSDKSIRRGFIKKVYSILTLQLLVTFGVASIFYFPQSVKDYVMKDPTIVYIAMGVSFALIIVLVCCPNVRRASPLNIIFLFLFTACEGVMLGTICAYYDSDEVLKAVVTTVVLVVALTLFAFQTKIDFTMLTGLLLCLLLGFSVFGLMLLIFPNSDTLNTLYAALGAILFSIYIVVDTQLMMGGKHKLSISPEEYIFASLSLYLDIINLFLMLLRLFGE